MFRKTTVARADIEQSRVPDIPSRNLKAISFRKKKTEFRNHGRLEKEQFTELLPPLT
jgi:hypothetical protein